MSNHFWVGVGAIGAVMGYLAYKGYKAKQLRVDDVNQITASANQPSTDGTGVYGPYPGITSNGAAGVNTNATGGDSGTIDNSRLFDPYAQGPGEMN